MKEEYSTAAANYEQAVRAISVHFMDENPDLSPYVMTIVLMRVTMGLYRAMTTATRARFMAGTEAMWDEMDKLEGYHE